MGDARGPSIEIEKVLIVGNEFLARAILQSFHATRQYSLSLLTYKDQEPYLPRGVSASEVDHRITDFTQASLEKELSGQDIVISTISPGDKEFQKRIIDACIAVHVPRFIPNEFGYDARNKTIQKRLPSYKARSAVLDHLHDVQDSIEWVGIAVGCILDHVLESGKLGFELKWQSATLAGRGAELFPATSLARVGDTVAKAVQRWDKVKNSYLYANGCTTSANQVVEFLQKATKSQWVVDFSDPKDLVREAERRLNSGFPAVAWILMERSVVFDRDVGGVQEFLAHPFNAQLGLETERVEDIVRRAVHEWKHNEKGDCGCG